MVTITRIFNDFGKGRRTLPDSFFRKRRKNEYLHEEKKQRENLSEKQIDNMLKDSFPASDPPSTY
ncbi:MAG: hypothetical protein J0L97_05450 [Alphaproteobacteria bacterium]|nr:hypothetical protein [Alphaproteobacteria bacterium]